MSDKLDLRVRGNSPVLLTKGINYSALTWNMESPPSDLTITMYAWNSGNDQTWAVGSGITVTGDNIIWDLGVVTNEKGDYFGKIESDDIVYGNAFRSTIEICVT